MTISGPFIDQDMNSVDVNTAYFLTKICLYKVADLQVNPPITGAIVLSLLTFPELTDVEFSRVRARGDNVYVMGVVNQSAAEADVVVFYSHDAGTTWGYSIAVADAPFTFNSYTVTYAVSNIVTAAGDAQLVSSHVREGDALVANNPLAVVFTHHWTDLGAWLYFGRGDGGALTNDILNATAFDDLDLYTHVAFRELATAAASQAALDSYFGVGGWTSWAPMHGWSTFPKEAARTQVTSFRNHCGTPGSFSHESWVFWNKPSIVAPKGFDIGKHNHMIVYVGTEDKIFKSTDGGAHFVEHIASDGANDIECHLAQSLADEEITFWSATTGELIRTVGGVVAGVYGGVLDVTPQPTPFRIASDPINGFPIWVLEHQGSDVYKLRKSVDGAVWSDITVDGSTSLSGARSLKEYAMAGTLQRRIILLKSNGIWYSTDEATFTNKIGDYADFNLPVVANMW